MDIHDKQRYVLKEIFKTFGENTLMPNKNLFTLNLKSVYSAEDKTYEIFNGITDDSFSLIRNQKGIMDSDLAVDFNEDNLKLFKEQYENLIDFYYNFYNNAEFIKRNDIATHDGTDHTFKNTTNDDFTIYLLKGFNFNTLNDSEKQELSELFNFYDNIWNMRNEVYEDYSKKKQKLLDIKKPIDENLERRNYEFVINILILFKRHLAVVTDTQKNGFHF